MAREKKLTDAATASKAIQGALTFGEYKAAVKKELGQVDKYDANPGFQTALRHAGEALKLLRDAGILDTSPMTAVRPMLGLILKGMARPDLQVDNEAVQ